LLDHWSTSLLSEPAHLGAMRASKLAALVLLLTVLLPTAARGEGSVGLWGTVVDINGNPLAGVRVTVYDSNNVLAGTVTTGADGRFHVPVYPGTYVVRLLKPGYIEKSVQVTVSKTALYADLGVSL
jgi:Alpha-2-macroglobulin MG1 domain.